MKILESWLNRGKHKTNDRSSNDARWRSLLKELRESADRRDWGLYRNTRFGMAEALKEEGKTEAALYTYLEVCYLDLNGPRNIGGADLPASYDFKPEPPWIFLAPGVLNRIRKLMMQKGLSLPEIEVSFIDEGKKVQTSLRLPVSPEEAWKNIEKQLT